MQSIYMNTCHDTYMYDIYIHVQYLFTYVISMRVYVYHICIYTPHTQINVSSIYGCVAVCCSVLQCVAVCCMHIYVLYTCIRVTHTYTLARMYTCIIHCNTQQHTATHCNTLQHTATRCNTLQHTATHCNTLQYTATHFNMLPKFATFCNACVAINTDQGHQHCATPCNTLQYTAIHCNTLQHTTTRCNTLQHTGAMSTLHAAFCIARHASMITCMCMCVRD